MAYASLREFLNELERDGQLVRVGEPVSTRLEMTEIQTRLLAEGGPAVLFENVTKHDGARSEMPVLINLVGTVERVARAVTLGGESLRNAAQLREVGETLAFLRQPEPPKGVRAAFEMLPLLRSVMSMKPKTVSRAPVQEIVLTGGDIDLARLPVQECWPNEPAPLITWPLVVVFNSAIGRGVVSGSGASSTSPLSHLAIQ